MLSVTSGCLLFALRMQSAQLAQCAASALPDARHKPSPPKFVGTPIALLACAESPAIHQLAEALPHRFVMGLDELLRQARSHHPELEIGSGNCAINNKSHVL